MLACRLFGSLKRKQGRTLRMDFSLSTVFWCSIVLVPLAMFAHVEVKKEPVRRSNSLRLFTLICVLAWVATLCICFVEWGEVAQFAATFKEN